MMLCSSKTWGVNVKKLDCVEKSVGRWMWSVTVRDGPAKVELEAYLDVCWHIACSRQVSVLGVLRAIV